MGSWLLGAVPTSSICSRVVTSFYSTMPENTSQTNKSVLYKYLDLPQNGAVCATYVWIDGTGEGMRSKVKCLQSKPSKVEDLPTWNYDGSSCYQADGSNSDVYLKPVKMYPCPFTLGDNILVLCETYNYKNEPMVTNNRKKCLEVMEKTTEHKPWFGIEQEYPLFDYDMDSQDHRDHTTVELVLARFMVEMSRLLMSSAACTQESRSAAPMPK